MKILILGAGKMGSFFCDLLSFDHEVAVYDPDPARLRFTFNALRFSSPDEIADFAPRLVINAATVKHTIDAFRRVLPMLPPRCHSERYSLRQDGPAGILRLVRPSVREHPPDVRSHIRLAVQSRI